MDLRHFFETETFAKTAVKTRDKPRHLGLDWHKTRLRHYWNAWDTRHCKTQAARRETSQDIYRIRLRWDWDAVKMFETETLPRYSYSDTLWDMRHDETWKLETEPRQDIYKCWDWAKTETWTTTSRDSLKTRHTCLQTSSLSYSKCIEHKKTRNEGQCPTWWSPCQT